MVFTPNDYYPFVDGSGAEKLADSQIAPLVAAVRGYRSFTDPVQAKQAVDYATPTGRETATFTLKRVRKHLDGDGDVMIMPWYSAQNVLDTVEGVAPVQVCQMRPKIADVDDNGRPQKYLFPGSSKQPVSMHPAVTRAWSESAPKAIITEGVIKEDSLLTGMLLAGGVSEDELRLPQLTTDSMDEWRIGDGLASLRALMDRIPREKRLTPMSVAGVAGWREGQFSSIQMRDREVLIAFDGDVATNPNVYRFFAKMWEMIANRGGRPRLLNLGSTAALMEIRQVEKYAEVGTRGPDGKTQMLGVDDFLSHVGNFEQLMKFEEADMPARPADSSDGFEIGDVRVSPGGRGTEEYVSGENGGYWKPRTPIGGKVSSITIRRQPTAKEVRDGVISDHFDQDAESIAHMRLMWELDGRRDACEFEVEAGLLAYPPDRWDKKRLNTLPARLTMLPEWPPRGDIGLQWLKAIKTSSSGHQEHRRWDSTGWVPGASMPVFVVGNQVLGKTREDEEMTRPEIDDTIIPSADRFGVEDLFWEYVDPDQTGEISAEGLERYKAQIRADIETVSHHFLNTGVFTDHRHYGAVLLATALRSTIPDRPRATVFFAGPPQSGKSYLASFIMGAWQNEPGTWTAQSLPGSASDTKAATERLVSSCGTAWVIDDLAPSASSQQATQTQQTIEDIVRAAFNGTSRSKSNMGGEGGLAKQTPPRAQIIVTAENALTTNSARGRTIQIDLVKGLVDDKASQNLIEQAIDTLALSRVTAAMIRYWHNPQPSFGGDTATVASWQERVEGVDIARKQMKDVLKEVLENDHGIKGGDSDRQMTMVCDLMLSFRYLQRLYEWAGGTDMAFRTSIGVPATVESYRQMVQLLDAGVIPYSATTDMFHLSVVALQQGKEQAIGRVLIDCIADAISGGKAHLQNPSVAGEPPFPDTPEFLELNRALGWDKKRDVWEGRGEPIGSAGTLTDGTQVAILNPVNSFQLAQKVYPSRIPFGQKPEANWKAAAAEGLAEIGTNGLPVRRHVQAIGNKQAARPRGVVVPLSELISGDL